MSVTPPPARTVSSIQRFAAVHSLCSALSVKAATTTLAHAMTTNSRICNPPPYPPTRRISNMCSSHIPIYLPPPDFIRVTQLRNYIPQTFPPETLSKFVRPTIRRARTTERKSETQNLPSIASKRHPLHRRGHFLIRPLQVLFAYDNYPPTLAQFPALSYPPACTGAQQQQMKHSGTSITYTRISP